MIGDKILDAMEYISEEYIKEAELMRKENRENKAKKNTKILWRSIGAFAAAAAVIVSSLFIWQGSGEELPIIPISGPVIEGMGEARLQLASIDDLYLSGGYEEGDRVKSLPVYKSGVKRVDGMWLLGEEPEELRALLIKTAEKIGVDVSSLEITEDTPSEKALENMEMMFQEMGKEMPDGLKLPTAMYGKNDDVTIQISVLGTQTVTFKNPIKLKGGTIPIGRGATYEEMYRAGELVIEELGDMLGLKNPVIDVTGGDLNMNGEPLYELSFYEKGNTKNEIINSSFSSVSVYGNNEGEVYMIRYTDLMSEEVLGDYPLISLKEAKALLSQGDYYTTVQSDLPKTAVAAKTNLVYFTSSMSEYYLPYYLFYVELDSLSENGNKEYALCYVLAVEPEYVDMKAEISFK